MMSQANVHASACKRASERDTAHGNCSPERNDEIKTNVPLPRASLHTCVRGVIHSRGSTRVATDVQVRPVNKQSVSLRQISIDLLMTNT